MRLSQLLAMLLEERGAAARRRRQSKGALLGRLLRRPWTALLRQRVVSMMASSPSRRRDCLRRACVADVASRCCGLPAPGCQATSWIRRYEVPFLRLLIVALSCATTATSFATACHASWSRLGGAAATGGLRTDRGLWRSAKVTLAAAAEAGGGGERRRRCNRPCRCRACRPQNAQKGRLLTWTRIESEGAAR